MMRTTEDPWAVSNTASPAARLNIRADQLIKCGTEVVSCDKLADRWVITVLLNGRRWAGVTFRNPFGVTRGELLGPRFALAGKVKLKVARGKVPKGAKGAIVGSVEKDGVCLCFVNWRFSGGGKWARCTFTGEIA